MNERAVAIAKGASLTEQEKAWVEARLAEWSRLNEGQRQHVERTVRATITPDRMHENAARYMRAQGIAEVLETERAPLAVVAPTKANAKNKTKKK